MFEVVSLSLDKSELGTVFFNDIEEKILIFSQDFVIYEYFLSVIYLCYCTDINFLKQIVL